MRAASHISETTSVDEGKVSYLDFSSIGRGEDTLVG